MSYDTASGRITSMPVPEDCWPELPTGSFVRIDQDDREPREGEMFYLRYPKGHTAFVLCKGEADRSQFDGALVWAISYGYSPAFQVAGARMTNGQMRMGDFIPDDYFRELIVGRVIDPDEESPLRK